MWIIINFIVTNIILDYIIIAIILGGCHGLVRSIITTIERLIPVLRLGNASCRKGYWRAIRLGSRWPLVAVVRSLGHGTQAKVVTDGPKFHVGADIVA